MSELRDRNLLYARLEEVLGPEPAGILMQHLPPESKVATSSDVAALSSQIDAVSTRIDGIDTRIDSIDTRIDSIEVRIDSIEVRMEGFEIRMERRMDRFDDRLDDFHAALREQTRHFILASTGTMVALTGMAFGAAALI